MIFFFYGTDYFRSKQKVDALKNKFRQTVDPSGNNIHTLDDQEFNLESFFNLVKSQGFLASKKLIILKNIFDLKNLTDVQDQIINWLKNQQDSSQENYVVFWQDGKPRSNSKLFKALNKFKYVQEFPNLEGVNLNKWIADTAKKFNCGIESDAINLLIALVGDNTWQLHNELHKLANQGQQNITVEQVKESVTAKTMDTIFEIIDACALRHRDRAHYLIDEQLKNGTEPIYLLAMIIRQFRLLARAHDVVSTINNSYALAQALDIHPFVAKKILDQVRNFNGNQIKSVYQLLTETDHQIKYNSRDTNSAFTLLIEKI